MRLPDPCWEAVRKHCMSWQQMKQQECGLHFFLLLLWSPFSGDGSSTWQRVLLPDRPWKWCNEPSDVSLSRLRLPRSASPRHPCFLPLWCLPTPSADRHKHSNESPVLIERCPRSGAATAFEPLGRERERRTHWGITRAFVKWKSLCLNYQGGPVTYNFTRKGVVCNFHHCQILFNHEHYSRAFTSPYSHTQS